MAWLISKAMMQAYENLRSSPEPVAEYSAANCLDGKQFAPSSMSHTPQAYLSPDKMTDFSRLSRFGMTFAPLTGDLGEDVLTWFLAGFPVRTLVQPGKVQELQGNAQDSGWKWRESLVKYDHDSRLWKTRQCSLLEGSEWFSETWPQWGLMRDGECWELPISARPTFGKESGLWPTPRSCSAMAANITEDAIAKAWDRFPNLETVVAREMWPGPSGNELGRAVNRFFQTPTARDWKSGKASQATMERNSRPLSEQIGGSLNPTWVEWLMGWPLGWTDLKPLETAKSHSAPPKPGGS